MISQSTHSYTLHVFLCCKKKEGKPSCGLHISEEMILEVKAWNKEMGYFPELKVTQTACLGQCNTDGGALLAFPSNRIYQGFTSIEEIKKIIREEYTKV